MKLFHFTSYDNLEGIGEHRLVPAIGEHSEHTVTLGVPVVWLTPKPRPTWMIGIPEDLCMLTLEVKRSKHLHHWRSWLAGAEAEAIDNKTGKPFRVVGKEVLAIMDAHTELGPFASNVVTDTDSYFIYTNTIHSRRIIECRRVQYEVIQGPKEANPTGA